MTARQIRRAAERKARKAAIKNSRTTPNPSHPEREPGSVSDLSRTTHPPQVRPGGPRTEAGKAISSQNALKTALTGRTVLLPADDRARYEQHLTYYFRLWNPHGEHECILVQAIADTWWRLARIPTLEAAIYAKGREEGLTEIDTCLKYEKQLRNLALQERRLSNYADRLKAELKESQAERQAAADSEAYTAEPPAEAPEIEAHELFGQFEFSTHSLDIASPLTASPRPEELSAA